MRISDWSSDVCSSDLLEGVEFFLRKIDLPNALPKDVQKELSRSVKESKHELKPLELAGEGWKSLYRNHAQETLSGLNTPNSGNLDQIGRASCRERVCQYV